VCKVKQLFQMHGTLHSNKCRRLKDLITEVNFRYITTRV